MPRQINGLGRNAMAAQRRVNPSLHILDQDPEHTKNNHAYISQEPSTKLPRGKIARQCQIELIVSFN